MQLPRTKSCCRLCSLRDRNRVWAVTPDDSKPIIAIFGEAPGRDEDREKTPFIGGAGSVLNWGISSAGVRRVNCFIGNIISCRPPDNNTDSLEGQEAIPLCRGGFFEDLDYLAKVGCTTILALGNTAMAAFKIEGSITKNRGSVYTYKHNSTTFTIIPTFHPSFIMRKHWKLDGGGTGDNGAAWVADFKKAVSIAQKGWEQLEERFNIKPSLEDVRKFVDDAIAHKRLIAVDTETTSLNINQARIVVCGLASSREDAICVPFLDKHGFPYWKSTEEPIVMAHLKRLFLSVPLLFQNSFYDIPILQRHGFEFNLDNIEDTLLLHHTLSPESEHNLGFIVSVYGKTPYWKSEFLNRTGSILEMDQESMRTYNLRDCVVLHQVYQAMYKDLEELDLLEFYNTEPRKLLAPLMEMRNTGMAIDTKAMHRFKIRCQADRLRYDAELRALGGICPEFNFDSDGELRFFLFEERPSKFDKLSEFENSNSRYNEFVAKAQQAEKDAEILQQSLEQMPPKEKLRFDKKILKLRGDAAKRLEQANRILQGQKYRELRALSIVKNTVKPIYTLKGYRPLTTDSGLNAIDEEGLLSYRIALNNRLRDVKAFVKPDTVEIEAIEKLLKWLALWHHYSKVDKLITTYTKYEPEEDGRIRPNWKAWGTATGRLSCLGFSEKIVTTRGSIPISTVKVGDEVLTHKGRIKRVTKVIPQGIKKTYRLTLANGRSIICTADHKFLSPTGWKRADQCTEVYYVNSQEYFEEHRTRLEGSGDVFGRPIETDCRTNRLELRGDLPQCVTHNQSFRSNREATHREILEVLAVEARSKLSHVWKDRGETSELERGCVRQERTLHNSCGRSSIFCASGCDGSGIGASPKPTNIRASDTPHRRESSEQFPGQSCSVYECWTQKTSPQVEVVASFTYNGRVAAYDISVEEDNSFVTDCGVVAHNCSAPNLMNLPKRKDEEDDPAVEVRQFFKARPGWKFVSCDYVNLEVYLLAYETLDPELLAVTDQGLNIHDINTKALFGIDETHPHWKTFRAAAKVFQFGRLNYGGSDYGVYRKVMLKVPDMQLTGREFAEASARWMSLHPSYVSWKDALAEEVTKTRSVKTTFGRLRLFLGNEEGIIREALSTKIQGAGASLVNRAMRKIYDERNKLGLEARFVCQVHDQLIMEAPDSEVETVRDVMTRVMQEPFEYKGHSRTVLVDPSVGQTFGDL